MGTVAGLLNHACQLFDRDAMPRDGPDADFGSSTMVMVFLSGKGILIVLGNMAGGT